MEDADGFDFMMDYYQLRAAYIRWIRSYSNRHHIPHTSYWYARLRREFGGQYRTRGYYRRLRLARKIT